MKDGEGGGSGRKRVKQWGEEEGEEVNSGGKKRVRRWTSTVGGKRG